MDDRRLGLNVRGIGPELPSRWADAPIRCLASEQIQVILETNSELVIRISFEFRVKIEILSKLPIEIFKICEQWRVRQLSLIHISEPTRRTPISYAVFC